MTAEHLPDGELHWLDAGTLTRAMRDGSLSAVRIMNASYDRIEAINPTVNAIVNLIPREAALALARTADGQRKAGQALGPLHGLPMAPKDLQDVTGFPTTQGFVPWSDRVALADGLMVSRLRAAGALLIGKTNVPEFGLGSHTFNRLFGATCNPYDTGRTAGGSSGGAAAALATGMLALADGTDMGGSLRNPAAFCNVVGMRPSVGRVPSEVAMGWLARLTTAGPMARSVADAGLLLSVQSGYWPADPLSLAAAGAVDADDLARNVQGLRIAWSPDLGCLPVDSEVADVIERAARVFEELGCQVERKYPDLTGAMDVFHVQRAAALTVLGRTLNDTQPDWRDHAKASAVWNIDRGLALSGDDLIASELARTRLYRETAEFFEDFDALVLPSAQVTPFPLAMEWITSINGVPMQTYIDWMTVCCAISITGLPAISVPGGFSAGGLPVGVQIVGKPRGDLALLQIAHSFEQATGWGQQRPPDPAP